MPELNARKLASSRITTTSPTTSLRSWSPLPPLGEGRTGSVPHYLSSRIRGRSPVHGCSFIPVFLYVLNSIQVYVKCFYNKNKPLHYLFHNRNTGICFIIIASQVVLVVKNPPANAGDIGDRGSIPGSRRSPREGHSNLQYSCLENLMDREA